MSLKDYIKPKKKEEPTENVSKNSAEKAPDPSQVFSGEKKGDYPRKENNVNGIKENNVNDMNSSFEVQSTFNPLADPRPDLQADSKLWESLFMVTLELFGDNRLMTILHGIRCGGTSLLLDGDRYILRPEIGDHCWESEAEYKKIRDSWLKPNSKEVKQALDLLYKEVKGG